MRWENLSVLPDESPEPEAARAAPPLPLALPNAVARTFDTPGFAGMTFYEVRAKSLINRVPSASRVPFEWTINPYRGCSHACVYCAAGDTPVLMAGGGTKRLEELRIGDQLYGTARRRGRRRYVLTEVLDHWSTVKPAYRVVLADGTELITSADHRFLTPRGWRNVGPGPGPGSGPAREVRPRPHLVAGSRLIGTGRFAEAPKETDDYRLGYLSGVIRGRDMPTQADGEALGRTRRYLSELGRSELSRSELSRSELSRSELSRSELGRSELGRALTDADRRAPGPTDEWLKGWLAGMFDVGGSRSHRLLRLTHPEEAVLQRAAEALTHLGFRAELRDRELAEGGKEVSVLGGLGEHLRFRQLTDPASTTMWDLSGTPVERGVDLQVISAEPLGLDLPLYDITTGTGDFIADGVVSHNCFARNTHTYLDLDAGQDFNSKVIVKVNAGELLRRELAAPKWPRHHIAMGTNVDCYQRAEGKYRLMRKIISALRDFANPFSILTKGTLILRDLDLLRQAAETTRVGVSFSVGFVDEAMWRAVEPGTPSPRRRLDAVRTLADAGFSVGVLMAPILPGLTDDDESIDATVAAIAAAGAASVTPLPLHLRRGAREWYTSWLAGSFPDLVPRYQQLYRQGSYLPQPYQREVAARVRTAARRHGLERAASNEARQVPAAPEADRSENRARQQPSSARTTDERGRAEVVQLRLL